MIRFTPPRPSAAVVVGIGASLVIKHRPIQGTNLIVERASTTYITPPSPPPASSRSSNRIPSPAGNWPIVGHLPRLIKGGDSLVNWSTFHEECGDHFRIMVLGKELIVSRDVAVARRVLGNGKNPFRTPQWSWRAVFDEMKWPHPIPSAEGEEWKRRRKVLAENFLAEKDALEYFALVQPIARKFVATVTGHLQQHTAASSSSALSGNTDINIINKNRLSVPLKSIMGNFALESVLKTVAGVDVEALTTPLPADAVAFMKSVETMFALTDAVEYNMWHAYFKTSTYVRLREAWRTMMQYPIEAMQPVLAEYAATGTLPTPYHRTILPQLLAQYESGSLSMDEVHGVAAAAVAAAVDTSGQTFEYLVYNLATNPDKQDLLYSEIQRVIVPCQPPPGDAGATTTTYSEYNVDQYNSLEYLKATVKESMRLTPTIGAHVRTLQDPLEVPELQAAPLPKGSTVLINYYAITRNPELYPDPQTFLPERFLKSSSSSSHPTVGCPHQSYGVKDPYSAIPFGHGPRKCTGKAFAELNIKLALLELLKRYRVSYEGPPLQQVERSLLRPTFPLEFTYHPRL